MTASESHPPPSPVLAVERRPAGMAPPWSELFAAPAGRTSVSPIARTLELVERTPGIVSFACGNPATEALPVDALAAAAVAALRDETDRVLQYGRPRGAIQEALAEHLARDGIAAAAEEILPTTGAIQGLSLLAHALISPGDAVVTEWPTYPVNLASFRAHGARTIGVPMDGQGMRADILDRLLEYLGRAAGTAAGPPAKLVYTIPDAQNPTGITMSGARRADVARVAAAHGVLLVEDGPYRRLTYGGGIEPALVAAARAAGARAVFVGSFAKSLAPGLRVGYVVAPPPLIDALVLLKQGEDFCTSGWMQAVVERLVRDGTLARQEGVLAATHGPKLAAMLAALDAEMRGLDVSWTRPSGGLFLWLTLPAGADAEALLERAIERGVAFIPGRAFYPAERAADDGEPRPEPPPRHTLRLNFSYPPLADIPRGVAALAAVLREEIGRA